MKEVKFSVEGVEGDFFVDADCFKDYKTMKAIALGEKNPAAMYEAYERLYMGKDEEYAERVGDFDALVAATLKAVNNSKN